jgi:hypothetical protein
MLLILIQRIEVISLLGGNNEINLYVVPKLILDERQLKPLLSREWKCTHSEIKYEKPILVGNYNIKRSDCNKIIKSDILINNNFDCNIFPHWSFKNIHTNKNKSINNLSEDINLRLQFILKPYEMNNFIGWDKAMNKYLAKQNNFYIIRKINIIYEEDDYDVI